MGVSRSRSTRHWFTTHFFSCLRWLCNLAFAQLESGEAVRGSANFPDLGFAIAGNFGVFITSFLRGKLDLELGARDILATLRGPKLYEINDGFGLTTCEESPENRFGKASVVMLSYNPPNSSMKQFMKYIFNAYKVHSILLQCFPLKSPSAELLPGICNCKLQDGKSECKCIVLWNVEEIISVLAHRMPGTLRRLSDSLCLLPCPECLETGCHGCKQGQLNVEERDESGRKILTEDDIKKGKKAVDGIFRCIHPHSRMIMLSWPCIPQHFA